MGGTRVDNKTVALTLLQSVKCFANLFTKSGSGGKGYLNI